MSRGKRYDNEPKLNIKKVIAVFLAIAIIILFVIAVKQFFLSDTSVSITTKSYFTLYSNDKWGVIDNNANIIIEPVYTEMITIPDSNKDVFICTENVNYENDTFTTKVLNSKNKQIMTGYSKIQPIENCDKYNNLWYEENVLKFEQDGKYGLINLNGKVILDAEYEDIYALKGIKNAIIVIKDSKMGLVDNKGKNIIPEEYIEIEGLGEDTNLYIVKDDKNYGIYDKTEMKYQEIKNLNSKELYCVKEDNKYKVINSNGQEVIDFKFDDIKQIKDNVIVYQLDKKFGAYDINSKKMVKAEYEDLSYGCENNFIAKKNDSQGIINIDGTEKKDFEYANIIFYQDAQVYELEPKNNENAEDIILNKNLEEIAKGIISEVNEVKSYIRVWTEEGYKYYNLSGEEKESKDVLKENKIFLSKKNGKYGYTDAEGNMVVDYVYDDAMEQNIYGFAAVKTDGKWGCIDSKGNLVCKEEYNLDDNLSIDFIGKYHLGKDINLMYYTDK